MSFMISAALILVSYSGKLWLAILQFYAWVVIFCLNVAVQCILGLVAPLLATSMLLCNSIFFSIKVRVIFYEYVTKLTVLSIYIEVQPLRFTYMNIHFGSILQTFPFLLHWLSFAPVKIISSINIFSYRFILFSNRKSRYFVIKNFHRKVVENIFTTAYFIRSIQLGTYAPVIYHVG